MPPLPFEDSLQMKSVAGLFAANDIPNSFTQTTWQHLIKYFGSKDW
jgi:hypothetical protein